MLHDGALNCNANSAAEGMLAVADSPRHGGLTYAATLWLIRKPSLH
jgi:hypothetical protein